MATINRRDVEGVIQTMRDTGVATFNGLELDVSLEPESHTDKEAVKLVPCRECARPMVTTTFFAPAKAICRRCSGEATEPGERKLATVGQPVPGQTDPAKAVNLAECLINKSFAYAVCPFDPEHAMELKQVSHAENYGPRKLLKYDKGVPVYDQQTGETVMWQCTECNTCVTYSTQHQHQYRRQNEPKQSTLSADNPNPNLYLLGARD